jgi:predicted ATPase
VAAKFEETSSPLTVVLSAFNDLCVLLAGKMSVEESQYIFERLQREFDQNLPLLVSTLPNVLRLASHQTNIKGSWNYYGTHGSELNFVSLCEIITRFVRIVSSQSCPILLALDDCQWSDSASLGIVHAMLSDKEGASTVLFVGTYRDNIPPTHIVFGFSSWLSKFNVTLTTIHLTGMNFDEVNSMVSDSLGIFPRLCEPLCRVIFRKTSGNPFFVKTFLWSLVDKHLLVYSLREMRWQWNLDMIISQDITPNVLDLLSAKLNNLSGSIQVCISSNIISLLLSLIQPNLSSHCVSFNAVQTAIQVASCFGIKITAEIVEDISRNSQYSGLKSDLNQAVEDGLLDLEADGSYRFVHDRVREASYDMIDPNRRSQFHFDLGMILFCSCDSSNNRENKSLFAMLDQIKHGIPALLHNESERITIAELNFEAGTESFRRSNYTMGYQYAKTALSLLPKDSWKSHFDLSLRLHCLLSKTAYAYRKFDEAKVCVYFS